jgi:RNA polymerase sigma-70 factor (ECF subfamily)
VSHRPGSTTHAAKSNFLTTHWSLVLAAAEHPRPDAEAALATLCERYWYPLYAFVRRAGHDADEARDLTQAFFARVIEKGFLRAARPERGRFRTFLLACLKHFLANEWDRATAQKRGCGSRPLPLDDLGEERYLREPADLETPERLFERHWALTVLERALDALDRDVAGEPASRLLARVKPLLAGDGLGEPYGRIAEDLGMSEGAVKTGVYRLRSRLRDLLQDEIAQTLADRADVESEIRFLLEAVGHPPSRA